MHKMLTQLDDWPRKVSAVITRYPNQGIFKEIRRASKELLEYWVRVDIK